MEKELIELAKRVRALAQTGKVYSLSEYDTQRYAELIEIGNRITALLSGHTVGQIADSFLIEKEYVTPKVDIRAVVFNDHDQILMVRESADGRWSLPGGWADVGYSPSEVAVKEVAEETGLKVSPQRLLAVQDKKCHDHQASLYYVYKIFIMCKIEGGQLSSAFDILDRGFFAQDNLPPLSQDRVTRSQIDLMYEYKNNPAKAAEVD